MIPPKVVIYTRRGLGPREDRKGRLDAYFFAIFDHTDLRISLSGAKFDEEADFDVRSAVGPPKPHQIDENLIFDPKVSRKFFFGVEKSKVANLPKRALPKFRADRSQVRGVNGRSKLAVAAVRQNHKLA